MESGLTRFIMGDLPGAVEDWMKALAEAPNDVELRQFVVSAYSVDPHLVDLARMPTTYSEPTDTPWGEGCITKPLWVTSSGLGLSAVPPSGTSPAVRRASRKNLADLHEQLKKQLDLHDFSGSLATAERILFGSPQDEAAMHAKELCTERLRAMYQAKLGDLQGVPQVVVRADEVPWLDLDQRSGFILSQVDGVSTYAEIVAISGLGMLETLRLLAELTSKKVIGVQPSMRKPE